MTFFTGLLLGVFIGLIWGIAAMAVWMRRLMREVQMDGSLPEMGGIRKNNRMPGLQKEGEMTFPKDLELTIRLDAEAAIFLKETAETRLKALYLGIPTMFDHQHDGMRERVYEAVLLGFMRYEDICEGADKPSDCERCPSRAMCLSGEAMRHPE